MTCPYPETPLKDSLQIGLVLSRSQHLGVVTPQYVHHFPAHFCVPIKMTRYDDEMGAQFQRDILGHAGTDAKLASFIRCRGKNSTLYAKGFPSERRIVQNLPVWRTVANSWSKAVFGNSRTNSRDGREEWSSKVTGCTSTLA